MPKIKCSSPEEFVSLIKETEAEWVDLRFTDVKGKWQHLTMDAEVVDEDMLEDGVMFDGSSIAGWKAINESDMTLMPERTRRSDGLRADPGRRENRFRVEAGSEIGVETAD